MLKRVGITIAALLAGGIVIGIIIGNIAPEKETPRIIPDVNQIIPEPADLRVVGTTIDNPVPVGVPVKITDCKKITVLKTTVERRRGWMGRHLEQMHVHVEITPIRNTIFESPHFAWVDKTTGEITRISFPGIRYELLAGFERTAVIDRWVHDVKYDNLILAWKPRWNHAQPIFFDLGKIEIIEK